MARPDSSWKQTEEVCHESSPQHQEAAGWGIRRGAVENSDCAHRDDTNAGHGEQGVLLICITKPSVLHTCLPYRMQVCELLWIKCHHQWLWLSDMPKCLLLLIPCPCCQWSDQTTSFLVTCTAVYQVRQPCCWS